MQSTGSLVGPFVNHQWCSLLDCCL